MKPGFLFRRRRSLTRAKRPTAVGATLALFSQAALVAVGSAAIGGCGVNPLADCTPTTLHGNDQAAAGAASSVAGDNAGLASAAAGPAGETTAQTTATQTTGAQTTAAQTTPARAGTGPAVSTVTLPTGEQIRVGALAGGAPALTPLLAPPGTGAASPGFVHLTLDGDLYMIPYEAVPYLGTLLDPRLFDLTYLARAGLSGTVPIQITYEGATAPALPGLRLSQAGDGTADATLTAAQGAQLGRLLAKRWQAGAAGLPGITRISLAQPPGGPPLPPAIPVATPGRVPGGLAYHTLTVKFTGMNGKAGAAVGVVQNVDDARLGTFLVPPVLPNPKLPVIKGTPGPLSFSLPDGTYSLLFSILSPHPGAILGVNAALVAKPQITVDANETVTMDARTTKLYQAEVSPPVTAAVQVNDTDIYRNSVTGGACGGPVATVGMGLISYSGAYGAAASQIRVSPTAPVTKGSFYFEADTYLDPYPDTVTKSAPRYYLDFPDAGSVPRSLTYSVPSRDLTTVRQRIYGNPPGVFGGSRKPVPSEQMDTYPIIYHSWGDFVFMGAASSYDNVAQGDRTDYWYTSDPKLSVWQDTFSAGGSCAGCTDAAVFPISSPQYTIRPGQQITENWNKWPLVPSPAAQYEEVADVSLTTLGHWETYPPLLTVPAASRQDGNGVLELQFGDSGSANQLQPLPGNSGITFYRDGQPVIVPATPGSSDQPPSDYYLPLLPQPATYALDWTQNEMPKDAAGVTTDWTFHSSPSDPVGGMPASELCPVDPTRPCSFLPLLFIGYDLPLDANSQATAGQPIKIAFTVGHQQNQAPPAGVSATLSASFNDGKTWTSPQDATALGHGQFDVTVSQPALTATNGFVSLRVSARDSAGNSVTQTIIRAYGLTG